MGTSRADNKKQIKAAIAFPTVKSRAAAFRLAGYSASTARHATTRTFEALVWNQHARALLKKAKVSHQRLGEKLSHLLDATAVDKNGVSRPDNIVQFRALELCLLLSGLLSKSKNDNAKLVRWTEIVCNTIIPQLPKDKQMQVFDALIQQANGWRTNTGSPVPWLAGLL